jgi:endonuclease/exonuclease/phosphatase family metal-dependent hydrolase
LAAKTLWSLVDSITATSVQTVPAIVLMGDFNAGGKDRIFKQSSLLLTDHPQALGTYCYRGVWQWIDHILVSPDVTTLSPATPLALPWLLEDDKTYGGLMPFRTYRGPTYHGGVSDHLPLLIDLQF